MAFFKNKQIKIKLLCERAEKEDILREELLAEGLSTHEIEKYIQDKRLEKYRKPAGTLPWDESSATVKMMSATNIGLADAHLVSSTAKDMNGRVEKRYNKYKDQKQAEKEQANSAAQATVLGETVKSAEGGSELKETKKQRKLEIEREHDRLIRQQNFRDHLDEMYKGMGGMDKNAASHYQQEFGFTKHMQDLCDNVNFDHHLLKNDIKYFSEAAVKYKGTMRK